MKSFKTYITESAKSDKYEVEVAAYMTKLGVNTSRPKVSSDYADLLIKHKGEEVWMEVKMNHTDNLGNTRVFFDGKGWDAPKKESSPLKKYIIKTLDKSKDAKKFVQDLEDFSGIKGAKIPTTKGGLKDPKAIPHNVMKDFFKKRNQYIMALPNQNLGEIVTAHYIEGKAEPTYYMQAGDDFYMIGKKNPLGLPSDIPLLSGTGDFRMRVGVRTSYYEVQPEVKIKKMPDSKYSVKPGTKKLNPFKEK